MDTKAITSAPVPSGTPQAMYDSGWAVSVSWPMARGGDGITFEATKDGRVFVRVVAGDVACERELPVAQATSFVDHLADLVEGAAERAS